MLRRELEICVETLQACSAAAEGGADRVELCAALGEGGVTPSRGFLETAVASSSIPVHVLLRPRSGNFVYSAAEFRILCTDLADSLSAGAAGVVVGALTDEGEIDRPRMGELMMLASGSSVTFHRAFDHTPHLSVSLEVLADLGCSRVLTSGGRPTVLEGLAMLQTLAWQAAGRLRVAAGGGVTLATAKHLLDVPDLDLHASLLPKAAFPEAAVGDPLWDPLKARRTLSVASVRTLSKMVHSA